MRRSKREVAAAIERIEAVGCTNIGDEERPLLLRPNDLRRVVDHFDDLSAEVKRLKAEMKEALLWLVDATVRKDWSPAGVARATLEDALKPKRSKP